MKPLYYAVAAASLDGFIARKPGHKSDWTSKEDFAHLRKMEDRADVLLLGSATYRLAKKALSKRNCIVLTRKVRGIRKVGKSLTYINPQKAGLEKLVAENGYKKICVLGGRGAYDYCLKNDLLTEIWLTIEPVVFGTGIGMFSSKVRTKKFRLASAKRLNRNGSILLHYKCR